MTETLLTIARAWVRTSKSGIPVSLPAGLKWGKVWTTPTGEPTSRYTEGAILQDRILDASRRIEITIDPGQVEDLIARALRSKGRRAQQGPITVKVLR